MISSQLSHLAQSPCMREGCSSAAGSWRVEIRGFFENQAMGVAGLVRPRAPVNTLLRRSPSRSELEGVAELEDFHWQSGQLALELAHEGRLQVVEQHVRAVALELAQLRL